MSINGWINKQSMDYTYSRILFGYKKEENSDTYYNMGER